MAGLSGKGPRAHRAKPAADAVTSSAAIAAADPAGRAADVVPAPSADFAPAIDAAVDPDPTIVARPDAPMPIVTASPVLAAEPTATDVQRQALAAIDPAAPTGEPAVVAGQPTIAIDPAPGVYAEQLPGATDVAGDPLPPVAGQYRDEQHQREGEAFLDQLRRDFDVRLDSAPLMPAPSERAVVRYVEVVGPQQGRRRAGRLFGPTATRLYEGEVSDAELDLIRGDPQLSCAVGEARVPVDLAPYD